jgi:pimeloyl-ACP methyl ester carboxylesterase
MHTVTPLHKPANGPAPVVALHSSGASARQWDAYRPLLPAATPFLTPALAGYDTEAVWPNGSPVTLLDEARRLLPLLMAQGQPVHLVGHSYGGAVALQAALLWPEHVRSLTLYEPVLFHLLFEDPASADLAQQVTSVGRRIAMLALSGRNEEAAALFVGYWSGEAAWTRLPAVRRVAVMARMSKVRAEFEALFAARFDVRPVADAGLPVRLVGGTRSPAPAQRVTQLLAQQLPRASRITIEGAVHMAPVIDPETMAPHLFHALATPAFARAA